MSMFPPDTFPLIYFARGLSNDSSDRWSIAKYPCAHFSKADLRDGSCQTSVHKSDTQGSLEFRSIAESVECRFRKNGLAPFALILEVLHQVPFGGVSCKNKNKRSSRGNIF